MKSEKEKGIIAVLFAAIVVITCLVTVTVAGVPPVIYVWQDTNDDGVKDTCLGSVSPYYGTITGVANYDFYSDSAHPINGPTPVGYESKMYFYEGSDGLSFGMFHNIDGSGSQDNIVHWDLDITGTSADVLLSDDDIGELSEPTPNHFEGRWHYWVNTDGGVIGDLVGNTWEIEITPTQWGDIRTWDIYSDDGSSINLNQGYTTYLNFEPCGEIPEFETIAIPVASILGLLFFFNYRKRRRE